MLGRICRGSDSRWLRGFIGLGTGSVTRQPQPGPRDPLPPCPESNMVSTETCNLTQWPAKALVLPVLAGPGQVCIQVRPCYLLGLVLKKGWWSHGDTFRWSLGRRGGRGRNGEAKIAMNLPRSPVCARPPVPLAAALSQGHIPPGAALRVPPPPAPCCAPRGLVHVPGFLAL